MPSGVYIRTARHKKIIERCLALGRTKQVQAKVAKLNRARGNDPLWRAYISKRTKEAMHRPKTRRKHLEGLSKAFGYDYFSLIDLPEGLKEVPGVTAEYVQRFWKRVRIGTKGECWPIKRKGIGYGSFWNGKEEVQAHRFVMMLKLGRRLEEKEQALHHCDNPPCCNPFHLFLGDNIENMKDRARKGRYASMPKGENHHAAKLTNAQVLEVKKEFKEGQSMTFLSIKYKVSRYVISYAIKREM